MSESNHFHHNHYYSWCPQLFHKHQRTSFQYPLFFIDSHSNFAFQLKTLRCFFLRVCQKPIPSPKQILAVSFPSTLPADQLISSITTTAISIHKDHLPPKILNPSPNLSKIEKPYQESVYNLFQKYSADSYCFANYAQAQLYHYGINIFANLRKALYFYNKGYEAKELGCMLMLIRITTEPDLADLFQKEVDYASSISLFLEVFAFHGFFDYFSTREPSIKQLALFNIYMDIFPGFKNMVHQVVSSNVEDDPIWKTVAYDKDINYKTMARWLLQLFSQEDAYSKESVDALQELNKLTDSVSATNAAELYFILGDLYDTSLYGVSLSQDLDKRVSLYSKAESHHHVIAASRMYSLLKMMENSTHDKKSPPQGGLLKGRSSEYYLKKLERFQGLDILRKKANDLISKPDMIKNLEELKEIHELLYYLDDHKTTSNYFRILKVMKSPFIYNVAKIMQEKKIGFYETPLAYCYEKGIGVEADHCKALEIYQEGFEKLLSMKSESKSFLYYRIGATICRTEATSYADFYFKLAASDAIFYLKRNPLGIALVFEISKLLLKGRGFPKKTGLAMEALESICNSQPSSVNDNFTILYARRKLEKVKRMKEEEDLKGLEVDRKILSEDSEANKSEPKLNLFARLAKVAKERYESIDIQKLIENNTLKIIVGENLQTALKVVKGELNKRNDSFNKLERIDSQIENSHDTEPEKDPAKRTLGHVTALNESAASILKEEDLSHNKKISKDLQRSSFQGDSPSNVNSGGDPSLMTPLTFLITELRKHGLYTKEPKIKERVQFLLEHHKKKSYNFISKQIQVSEMVMTKANFLKSAIVEYSLQHESGGKLGLNIMTTIQNILTQLVFENNVRVFRRENFQFSVDSNRNRTLATHNENSQVFEVSTVIFSLKYAAELMADSPALFLLPLYFSHPQFFPIYGISFVFESTNIVISYFVEPKKMSLSSYLTSTKYNLSLLEKISIATQILYSIQAFHTQDFPLLTATLESFAITSDNEIKLYNLFIPLFDNPSKINTESPMRAFEIPLENLSPDVFRLNGRMSTASDIFCFGLMFYELLTGEKLYNFSEFNNESNYCKKIQVGYIKQKFTDLTERTSIQLPSKLEDLLLRCLSFHKKKRPTVDQLISTLQSLKQMFSNPEAQISIRLGIDVPNKLYLETPFSWEGFMAQQYRALQFATAIDPDDFLFFLPGVQQYKGHTVRKVPNGAGEFTVGTNISYKGNFQKGVLHGKGVVHLLKREEYFRGTFAEGSPVSGLKSSFNNEEGGGGEEVSYEKNCWIPKDDYRNKMMKNFEPMSVNVSDYLRLRKERLSEDHINLDLVGKYTMLFTQRDYSKQRNANMVDCFGNFYYLLAPIVTSIKKISSFVMRGGCLVDTLIKIYDNNIKQDLLFQAEFSGLALRSLKGKNIEAVKCSIVSCFDSIVRYYYFGYKYLGKLENGYLRKGLVHIGYTNYFWYESPVKLYQGANFVKESNCLYIGNVLRHKAEDFGTEYIGKMKKYEGEYLRGIPHGRGVIYNENGKIGFSGILRDGRPYYGTYYEDKRQYEGRFIRGAAPETEEPLLAAAQGGESPEEKDIEAVEVDLNSNLIYAVLSQQKPHLKVIPSLTGEDHQQQQQSDEEAQGSFDKKTEFEGTVQNFSETIKEVKGKFLLEDKKFNGHFKIIYTDGSKYDGYLKDGVRHGQGTFIMGNGSRFVGLWDHGNLKGKIIWGSASKVLEYSEGEFIREKGGQTKHNNFGRLKFKNGDFYEGEIRQGLMEGFGMFRFKNGEIYRGMIKNNKPEGIGKFWFQKGHKWDSYEGEFKDGKKEGYGVIYSNNQAIFKGRFVNDLPVMGRVLFPTGQERPSYYLGFVRQRGESDVRLHKWGRLILGRKYVEGEYDSNHLKDEVGEIVYFEGEKTREYFGEVKNNRENGLGQVLHLQENQEIEEIYQGEWVNGMKRGVGMVTYEEEKSYYKGEIFDGLKEGIGEWKMEDGTIYRGEFRDDMKEGKGMINRMGKVVVGEYKEGILQHIHIGGK